MLFSRHFEHLIEQLLLLLIWLEQYFKAFEMVTNWYPRVIVVEIDKAPDPLGCEMKLSSTNCVVEHNLRVYFLTNINPRSLTNISSKKAAEYTLTAFPSHPLSLQCCWKRLLCNESSELAISVGIVHSIDVLHQGSVLCKYLRQIHIGIEQN